MSIDIKIGANASSPETEPAEGQIQATGCQHITSEAERTEAPDGIWRTGYV